MKRVLFFIVFVLIGLCSYAQVSLKINSIDMSRRDKIQERPDVIKLIANGYPSFRIEATVTNNSQDSIWIRYHDYSGPEDVQLQFYDYGRYYYKSLSWILKYDDNLLLPPHTKRKVVFWTTIPTETEVPEPSSGLRPWHWRWDTKDPHEYEAFQVFNLGNYYLDDNLYYRIYIGGMIGPFPIENPHRLLGTKSYIPTRFEEQNGKLFLWDDKNAVITSELLDAMRKYNCIDSLTNCLTINDRNDGVTYIVDARNLSKYVKINGGNIKNSAYYRSLYFMKFNAL